MTTLTIAGTAADDTIVITATGSDSGTYCINGGSAVAFSGVTQVVVTGEDGNDTLTIVNPDGSPVRADERDRATTAAATGRRARDPGRHGERPHLHGRRDPRRRHADVYRRRRHADHRLRRHCPDHRYRCRREPHHLRHRRRRCDHLADGGLVNGFQTTQVSAPTFESIRFANKTSVTIIGNGGADTLAFNNPTPAAGLSTLNVVNVGAVTQSGAVNYTNLSLDATGAVTLIGGDDVTSLSAASSGSAAASRSTMSTTSRSPPSAASTASPRR